MNRAEQLAVQEMYLSRGYSYADVRLLLGCVIFSVARTGSRRRRKIAVGIRRGPDHPNWKGDQAGYNALHRRVEAVRGKPMECEKCGCTSTDLHWANMTGNYHDVWDYKRLCPGCHKRYDMARRRCR